MKKKNFCTINDFEDWLYNCNEIEGKKYVNKKISNKGGLAYVDLDGNCSPDIVLTHEENKVRYIEIYTSKRQYDDKERYCLFQEIKLPNEDEYGALTITKLNDEKSKEKAPLLDIIVPLINENKIRIYKNIKEIKYKWSNDYCKDDYNKFDKEKKKLFDESGRTEELSVDGYNLTIDSTFPTSIRVGDFLGSSNPGILLRQIDNNKNVSIISLFKRDGTFKHYTSIEMNKIREENKGDVDGNDDFLMGLFFDIDETGTLSLIISTKNGKNYFFLNYKRNVFFFKIKINE